MQVILLEQIQGVGKMGETVNVARGFARNFLLPRNKALHASKENMAKFEGERSDREIKRVAAKSEAEDMAKNFDKLSVTISRQASETGMLYGSIKARDIEAALSDKDLRVARSTIQIGSPIKEIAEYSVQIFLHPEVVVSLKVNVERQSQA